MNSKELKKMVNRKLSESGYCLYLAGQPNNIRVSGVLNGFILSAGGNLIVCPENPVFIDGRNGRTI